MNTLLLPCLVLHGLTTVLFFLCVRRSLPVQQAETETLFVLLLPFFGAVILVGMHLLCRHAPAGALVARHKLQRDARVFSRNMRQEADIIPLNDALFVENPQQKRRFFTEAIKQNMLQNQQVLQQAVHDEDREIAYYAISMLTTKLEALETQLFQEEKKLHEENVSAALLNDYAANLREYIAQKFIDPMTRRQKEERYAAVLGRLVAAEPEKTEHYREKICQDIRLACYDSAQEVCALFLQHFPGTEQPYLMFIRLYQARHEPEALQQKIDELKALPIKLTIEAMEVIRFWDRKGAAANV